jgi:hypothetical protein
VSLNFGKRITDMSKGTFYYLMDLISDFPKNVMIGMLLENKSLKAGDFINSPYHLHSRDVYGNLNRWVQEGVVLRRPDFQDGSFAYSLVGAELMDRLGGGQVRV